MSEDKGVVNSKRTWTTKEVYEEGMKAHFEFKKLEDCPYKDDVLSKGLWERGWKDVDSHRITKPE